MATKSFKVWILLIVFFVLPVPSALAEIKVFEKEVEEIVGRDQSQEQVEAFALQKAKRLAVEEAGTYISSLTVVRNYQLEKDEITALASGVVKAEIIGIPSVRLKNGVIHIAVKSRIEVDTSILDRQIKQIMKDRETLRKLEKERRKVRELEDKLASLKSTELKKLEELNAQAIAMERARERQRLLLAEQVLKAKGELKKSEIERLQRERKMQARIDRMIAEQEKTRREEARAIEMERDRIRRAQLENEQRWKELIRKSQLRQAEWVPIDDRLSLKYVMEEVAQLKDEIVILNQQMDLQYKQNKMNLKKAFEKQFALTATKLPQKPSEKDLFETTEEHNKRLAAYASKVEAAKFQNQERKQKLKTEEKLLTVQARVRYLEQKVAASEPFVKRLQSLQEKKFLLPEGNMIVTLGPPDADHSRFSLKLQYKDRKWTSYWNYTDRDQARDFWNTRNYLRAQGLFQLEEKKNTLGFRLSECRVFHPGTGESRDLFLEKPQTFSEITAWHRIKKNIPAMRKMERRITFQYETGGLYKDSLTGIEFILVDPCFPRGFDYEDETQIPMECGGAFLLGKYEVTQGQWKRVMGFEDLHLTLCDSCPVENVSLYNAQAFIKKLNQMAGTTKYRLPTVAEWEYACRAGSTTKFSFGEDYTQLGKYAWYAANSGRHPHPVGQKRPNSWGFYDMLGNVSEWCSDSQSGEDEGSLKYALKGGAWNSTPAGAVASASLLQDPDFYNPIFGFRAAMDF